MENTNFLSCAECKSRKNSIFNGCSLENLLDLDEMKTCRYYKKGEELFEEGKHPRGLFCVISGKIKVLQKTAEGKEQIVHLISDGKIMGHRALFGDDTYSCSAVAMEDSKVCFLPKTQFYNLITNNSKLTLEIAHLLADELKEAEGNITSNSQHSVANRIAKTLCYLPTQYGYLADGKTINLKIKREDMASMVGTTRETATRVLYKFKEEGLIEFEGKYIKLLKFNQLKEMCE